MKKYFLSVILIFIFNFLAAQTVSFYINGHADDMPLFMSSKFMADIKAGNKTVLITLTASDEGNGNASFNGSSIPFYIACERGLAYTSKSAYDIAFNATISPLPVLQTVSLNSHLLSKYVYKNTVNYFLRLPDGGAAGSGYPQTGNASLQKLNTGGIASITAVDGSSTYTGWNDITNTIASIINLENGINATYINTPSVNPAYNPAENSDHFYAGAAAQNAVSLFSWAGINEFICTSSSSLPVNLSTDNFLNSCAIFSVYSYPLLENNYQSKYTSLNKAYLPLDYYNVLKIPNSCSSVTGMGASNITSAAATISWAVAAGNIGYDVEYKNSTSNIWITAASGTTAQSINLTGLTSATVYDYRVRRKCTNNSYSAYTALQFTTPASVVCNTPAALANSNITTSAATISWAAVSGVLNYTVEYKLSSSSTWLVLSSALTSTAITVNSLNSSSNYDWRVKANCSNGAVSTYASSAFTTAAPLTCGTPANPTALNITGTSALLGWDAVTGVLNYTVEYKLTSSSTWLVLSSALTASSIAVTGLTSNTNYDWRVKANCTNGVVSAYRTAAFLTSSSSANCVKPVALYVTGVTPSQTTLLWDAVSNVTGYTVKYKEYGTATWQTPAVNITNTTFKLTGLKFYTIYEWQIVANCTNGSASPSDVNIFLTSCMDLNEPNNTLATASTLLVGGYRNGQISTTTDVDIYKFTTVAPNTNFAIRLFDLPHNYDLVLYNSAGNILIQSQSTGNSEERIVYNTASAGTYYYKIYSAAGAFDTTQCYNSTLQGSSTPMSLAAPANTGNESTSSIKIAAGGTSKFADDTKQTDLAAAKLYPQPATNEVSLQFYAVKNGNIIARITDINGKLIQQNTVSITAGKNNISIPLLKISSGIYLLQVINNEVIHTKKLIITR
jgi:Secretion system C-terminal sorting domain/Fibronectin type III domain